MGKRFKKGIRCPVFHGTASVNAMCTFSIELIKTDA